MDGASESRIFAQIFMPLIQPALATAALFSFLFSWNSFLWPLIVAQSESTYTLPIGLQVASQLGNTSDFGLLMAGSMVIMAPIVTLFLFLQRYFVQGLATVGLK
jgi:multiple sugar transport system permease protein